MRKLCVPLLCRVRDLRGPRFRPNPTSAGGRQDRRLRRGRAANPRAELLLLSRTRGTAVGSAARLAATRAARRRLRPCHHAGQQRRQQTDQAARARRRRTADAADRCRCRMTRSAFCERGSIRAQTSGPRSGRRHLRAPVDPKVAAVIAAVRSRDRATLETLIAADPALVTSKDAAGSTPLHHAAGFGALDSLAFLVDKGADVNAKNRRGSTPLFWALHDEAKVRLLISRGAAVNDQAGRRAHSGVSGSHPRQWLRRAAPAAGQRRRSECRDAQWADAAQRRSASRRRRCDASADRQGRARRRKEWRGRDCAHGRSHQRQHERRATAAREGRRRHTCGRKLGETRAGQRCRRGKRRRP